jgi:lipopolysaccharide export system protein LptA
MICAILIFAGRPPVAAQGLTGLQSGKGPLEITADQGIEWRRREKLYVARGNARAARGSFELYADALTAHYRELAEGGTEVSRIVAEGRVRIVSPGETVYADHGVYEVDRGLVLLRGRDLRLETERDLVRARDSLEFWERQRVAVARGDALARRDDQEIRADVLTAYFKPGAGDRLEMRTVKADGDVRISTATEFARGDEGVYYVAEQLATLSGAVKISRGENLLSGEYAEVDLASGVSRLSGAVPGQPGDARVRGLLVPDSLDKSGNGSPQ